MVVDRAAEPDSLADGLLGVQAAKASGQPDPSSPAGRPAGQPDHLDVLRNAWSGCNCENDAACWMCCIMLGLDAIA